MKLFFVQYREFRDNFYLSPNQICESRSVYNNWWQKMSASSLQSINRFFRVIDPNQPHDPTTNSFMEDLTPKALESLIMESISNNEIQFLKWILTQRSLTNKNLNQFAQEAIKQEKLEMVDILIDNNLGSLNAPLQWNAALLAIKMEKLDYLINWFPNLELSRDQLSTIRKMASHAMYDNIMTMLFPVDSPRSQKSPHISTLDDGCCAIL